MYMYVYMYVYVYMYMYIPQSVSEHCTNTISTVCQIQQSKQGCPNLSVIDMHRGKTDSSV